MRYSRSGISFFCFYALSVSAFICSQIYLTYYAVVIVFSGFGVLISAYTAVIRNRAGFLADATLSQEIRNGVSLDDFHLVANTYHYIGNNDNVKEVLNFSVLFFQDYIRYKSIISSNKVSMFLILIVLMVCIIKSLSKEKTKTMPFPDNIDLSFLKATIRDYNMPSILKMSCGGTFITSNYIALSFPMIKLVINQKYKDVLFILLHENFHKKSFDVFVSQFMAYLSIISSSILCPIVGLLGVIPVLAVGAHGAFALITIPITSYAAFYLNRKPYHWLRCLIEHLADGYASWKSSTGFAFEGARLLRNHPAPIERLRFLKRRETHYQALLQVAFLSMLICTNIFFNITHTEFFFSTSPGLGYLGVLSNIFLSNIFPSLVFISGLISINLLMSSSLGIFLNVACGIILTFFAILLIILAIWTSKKFSVSVRDDIAKVILLNVGGWWTVSIAFVNVLIGVLSWRNSLQSRERSNQAS